eukprot:6175582-Pleurochrysis_carterae.AAC.3
MTHGSRHGMTRDWGLTIQLDHLMQPTRLEYRHYRMKDASGQAALHGEVGAPTAKSCARARAWAHVVA